MIHHIKGKLMEITPTYAVVDTASGVGYMINITLHTYTLISAMQEVCLYTYPIYKEDAQVLFGFYQKDEREIFSLLLSVSGVGGNTARVILSSLTAEEVQTCIASGNVALLQSVKGIGAKTAQRIIVDLKDKVTKVNLLGEHGGDVDISVIQEASVALETLGYPQKQTQKLLSKIFKEKAGIGLEELIKTALKGL